MPSMFRLSVVSHGAAIMLGRLSPRSRPHSFEVEKFA
jgi:hypothetical protein